MAPMVFVTRMKCDGYGFSGIAVIVLLSLGLTGCAGTRSGAMTDPQDSLAGWYQMTDSDTIIPVFKRDGIWYSVCRGFETPFRETPKGLEWDVEPSSMKGTTISFNEKTRRYSITVVDSQLAQFNDNYPGPESESLTKIETPGGLPNVISRPPRNLEDFVGWYQPVYYCWFKYQIRNENGKYILEGKYLAPDERDEAPCELSPLVDQLGFTGFDRRNHHRLIYNNDLQRYEIIKSGSDTQPIKLRMPLARVGPPSPKDTRDLPQMAIGIPTWH